MSPTPESPGNSAEVVPTPPHEYYRFDVRRLGFAESWRVTRSWKVVAFWIAKIFGASLPTTIAFPVPRPLKENRVGRDDLSLDSLMALDRVREECEPLGFADPIYYTKKHTLGAIDLGACILRQPSGESVANVSYAALSSVQSVQPTTLTFYSVLRDRRLLITSNELLHLDRIPADDAVHLGQAEPAALYKEHLRRLEIHRANDNSPETLVTFDEVAAQSDESERREYEFHLARGLYVRMTPVEVAQAQARWSAGNQAAASSTPAVSGDVHAILAALDRREKKSASSVKSVLLLLIFTLAAFIGLGFLRWGWEFLVLLVGTLLLHETGHFLAMRAFGYRNLRMFFIPFFGAAVSGLNPRAPGWQKAVVALAGPVPGIVLGATLILLVRNHFISDFIAIKVGAMLLGLNLFNLLPLVPLDGGRFFEETLFSRNGVIRAGFIVLAAVGMAVLAYYLRSWAFGFLAFLTYLRARTSLRVDRALRRLRADSIPLLESAPMPGQEEPLRLESLPALVAALKENRQPPPAGAWLASEAVLAIDQARARPPGAAATLGLLAVYGATCALAIICLFPLISSAWSTFHHRHPRYWQSRSHAPAEQRGVTADDEPENDENDSPVPVDSGAEKP